MSRGGMFSEAWHRVAKNRAALHPSVEVQRQRFRGVPWYVLRDPYSNQFFRISEPAYRFVARLRMEVTIEEAWKECLELYPEEAPGQQEIVQLLAQLHQSNLLTSDLPPDAAMMAERGRKRDQKELQGKLKNFLFIKFGLLDPSPVIEACLPFFRILFNRWGGLLWIGVMLLGLKAAGENWEPLWDQTEGLLAPSNLFLLYVCGVGAKAWHELGHGLICRFFGGEVRTLGVMLLIFTPLPYIDATSSWGFSNKWHRILVSGAGMIFEFFLAAIALIVWANTSEGTIHAAAYNLIVIASVTTFLFNINPLLRFDGYYILCDWIEVANLGQRANKHIKYLSEKFLFKVRRPVPVTDTLGEGWWLFVYGISAAIYRVFLLAGIVLLVADQFFGIGLVIAVVVSFMWLVLPIGKFIKYLFTDPVLEPVRQRAICIVAGTVGGLLILLAVVPFPRHVRAEGIVEAVRFQKIFAVGEGRLVEVLVEPGVEVTKGTPLLRLENNSLDLKLKQTLAQFRESQARLQSATLRAGVEREPFEAQLRAIKFSIENLRQDQEELLLRAPLDGIWASPQLTDMQGGWFAKGAQFGVLVQPGDFRFMAALPQTVAGDVFLENIRSATIRLYGETPHRIRAHSFRRIPGEQRLLPTSALGWKSGGAIEVDNNDPEGRTTKEPFFLVTADIDESGPAALYHHRRGVIRFHTGYEPLLQQGWRWLRQLLQQRLKL